MLMTGKCVCVRFVSIILLMVVLCAVPVAEPAEASESQVIRVGFFQFDGYHIIDETGRPSGYGYDLLQHMAGYTDWNYEYVGYENSWSEMQEMLENGEIDLLTSAQKTEERMERFDFSEESIGTSAAILTVKAGNEQYLSGDYQNWSGMRIGLLFGNSRNHGLEAYAKEQGFTYEPVYFDDTQEMINALKTGNQIDAVLTSNLRSIKDEWVLAQFDSAPFFILVKKGNTKLLEEVNHALSHVFSDEPGLRTKLFNTYYTPDSGDEIAFTAEERDYIAAMQGTTLKAVLNPDRTPLSYFDNGEPDGIIGDIALEIIARSGLNIELVETKSREEYSEALLSGNVDIRFDARFDYQEAEALGSRLTTPYLEAAISRLFLRHNKNIKSAAMLRNSDIMAKYESEVKELYSSVTYYDTVEEVREAILQGRQDVALLYTRTCEYLIHEDVTNRLTSEKLYGSEIEFAVEIFSERDPLLFSILNRVVASIGTDEIAGIDKKHTTYEESPFSIIGYMYNNPFVIFAVIILFFVLFILVAIAVLQARAKREEEKQFQEEKRRNALLSDALAAAEQADSAKSQFLSRVSHEMRTPLNAIIGFMTLAKDAEPQLLSEYLSNAEIAAKQLLAVINDVLDMSAIESGKMKIAREAFDFKQLINSLATVYDPLCGNKGITFETKLLTPVDECLIGDSLRVNQVLLNLLGNAVKFTEKGKICLSIRQLFSKDDITMLRFEISDTGCGMTAELQERLFRPFEQESAVTARKHGGSGLGLSIVKNLVNMMDGEVTVKSEAGKGTTFTVDLPFGKVLNEQRLSLPEGSNELHVLAVDDEMPECDYLSKVFTRIGIRHTCVASGEEALVELERAERENDRYNVCLVDWKMPNMSGNEVTQEIRKNYGTGVIVIVVSAYEYYEGNESAKTAGADLFLSKPLFQSSLFDFFMTLTKGSLHKVSEASMPLDYSGKRILLAEDNEMNRMVAEGLVKKSGILCESAENGQIALDMFSASPVGYYDAILMDIQMPVMDGFEATLRIRELPRPDAESIQIIAVTANAFKEDIAKTLSSGMNDHVAKPIDHVQLLETLGRAFAKRR